MQPSPGVTPGQARPIVAPMKNVKPSTPSPAIKEDFDIYDIIMEEDVDK